MTTHWKNPDAGKDWGQEEKAWQTMTWLDDITNSTDVFEQTLGDSERQGSLACCRPWSLRVECNLAIKLMFGRLPFWCRAPSSLGTLMCDWDPSGLREDLCNCDFRPSCEFPVPALRTLVLTKLHFCCFYA